MRRVGCKLYYAEEAPAGRSAEPTTNEMPSILLGHLHCMLPPEEMLTPGKTSGVEARVNESSNIFVG